MPIATVIFVLFVGAAFPGLAGQLPSANSDERAVADFYRGKVVRIVFGFPQGGGADIYSRILARYFGKSIPGNPIVAVTNIPGAGSIIAGNHIFNAGATDGTDIGMLNGAVILEQLFGTLAPNQFGKVYMLRPGVPDANC
jgi:tripartite-type tricarboxylate transporter receptor subunit TctC